MSVEIRAKVICDGCGAVIEGMLATETTYGMETWWDCKKKMKQQRWVIAQRYGKARHFCQPCADGSKPPNEKGQR